MKHRFALCIMIMASMILGSGCASYRTVTTAEAGTAKVYSGTRLNLHAALERPIPAQKFKAEPPAHPLLDLPFSLLLDTLILPVTLSTSMYEAIFE